MSRMCKRRFVRKDTEPADAGHRKLDDDRFYEIQDADEGVRKMWSTGR